MAMVSNKFLGALCVKLGFHRHLQTNQSQLLFAIQTYVADIEEAEKNSNGSPDYWTTTKNPPKVLVYFLIFYSTLTYSVPLRYRRILHRCYICGLFLLLLGC